MDSFLSGFSHGCGGTQTGQGYTGAVGASGGNLPAAAQGADIAQLQPGDTFQGEIASVNGEDVQILLANGQYMAAKLERDVQVALGQILSLQVQSNKDSRIVLKPIHDGRVQMVRVGEAALRAARMAVTDKNLALVSKLIENGLSIDKNTLMAFNRLSLQNPHADMADIIKLNKMRIPVNDNTLTQLQNYRNMEHKLLDGIKEASDEILKIYDALTGGASADGGDGRFGQPVQGNVSSMPDAPWGTAAGQAALESGGRFMEQVLTLLSGEDGQGRTAAPVHPATDGRNVPAGENPINPPQAAGTGMAEQPRTAAAGMAEQPQAADRNMAEPHPAGTGKAAMPVQGEVPGNKIQAEGQIQGAVPSESGPMAREDQTVQDVAGQLKGERPQALPAKIITLISEGKLDIKGTKQLLMDSGIGGMMTVQQKSVIFRSAPFLSMLKNGLRKRWTLTPQELTQEGRVEEFYQKLMKESSRMSRMMNEALQAGGQDTGSIQARAMDNISRNVEFMNQVNQMFNYIQLPLKLGSSQAHGDLYVYTNKKNMARRDGMLTAFLHLDMAYLGALDVSIALQTDKNRVTAKFYLDEDSMPLVEGHIDELSQRLARKGYQCRSMILEKEEDKTVMEHIEEQIAGGGAMLSYQTFDTRA